MIVVGFPPMVRFPGFSARKDFASVAVAEFRQEVLDGPDHEAQLGFEGEHRRDLRIARVHRRDHSGRALGKIRAGAAVPRLTQHRRRRSRRRRF